MGSHIWEKHSEPIDSETSSHITEHRPLRDSEPFSHIMEHRRILLAASLTHQTHLWSYIFEELKSPDIIFLQEVTSDVRAALFKLDDARVRAAFLVTDAEDQTSFEDVPFATMTFISRARFASGLDSRKESDDGGEKFTFGSVSRVTLPSQYGRDALCVDIIPSTTSSTVFRLINVHLDSFWHTLRYRAQQMEILANVLRESGCGGGIIAGDFNAIRPEDDGLVHKNELVDAWVAFHTKADHDRATWGVGVERRGKLQPRRLDKVAMTRMGVKAEEIEVLLPGSIEVPSPRKRPVEIPWSDHFGLKCTFTI